MPPLLLTDAPDTYPDWTPIQHDPQPAFAAGAPTHPVTAPQAIIEHHHKAAGGAFRTGFGVALGCMVAVGLTFGGCLVMSAIVASSAKDSMKSIEQQVAADAVQQYEIAKRNGSAMDAYVQSGFVVAAFLQANDEANYQKWKQIQAQEARRAGVPNF